jgi:hypothetical protein
LLSGSLLLFAATPAGEDGDGTPVLAVRASASLAPALSARWRYAVRSAAREAAAVRDAAAADAAGGRNARNGNCNTPP